MQLAENFSVADVKNRMQARAAHIGINNQNLRAGLRETDRRVNRRRGLAFRRQT